MEINRLARRRIGSGARLEVLNGSGRLIDEDATRERLAELTTEWFVHHLAAARTGA